MNFAVNMAPMGRKTDENKKSLAFILFMNGMLQKDICQRVNITPKTLQRWVVKEAWKEKLAAKTITRTELVNKVLSKIYDMLSASGNVDADALSKLASTIERLDKKDTPVIIMEVFMRFGNWLQQISIKDKDCDLEFIKKVTRYQDKYVTERMAQ
ncbi:MAG: terminase [Bacteroidales bacterium]|nr:terminase [Bacteroidales bacterium]